MPQEELKNADFQRYLANTPWTKTYRNWKTRPNPADLTTP
jgi:hypothetical protein